MERPLEGNCELPRPTRTVKTAGVTDIWKRKDCPSTSYGLPMGLTVDTDERQLEQLLPSPIAHLERFEIQPMVTSRPQLGRFRSTPPPPNYRTPILGVQRADPSTVIPTLESLGIRGATCTMYVVGEREDRLEHVHPIEVTDNQERGGDPSTDHPGMKIRRSSVEGTTVLSSGMASPMESRGGSVITPQSPMDTREIKGPERTMQAVTQQFCEVRMRKKRRKREVGVDCSNEACMMIGRPGPITRSRARMQALTGL